MTAAPTATVADPAVVLFEQTQTPANTKDPKPLWPRTYEFAPEYTFRSAAVLDTDAIWVDQSQLNIATTASSRIQSAFAVLGLASMASGAATVAINWRSISLRVPEPRDVFVADRAAQRRGRISSRPLSRTVSVSKAAPARALSRSWNARPSICSTGAKLGHAGFFREFNNSFAGDRRLSWMEPVQRTSNRAWQYI